MALELLPYMILLLGSFVLHFASTKHIFHSPLLGICFVLSVIVFGEIMCVRDSYVCQIGGLCRLLFLARLCVFGTAMSVK